MFLWPDRVAAEIHAQTSDPILPLFVFKLATIFSLWSCGIIHICVYGNIITTRVPRRRELGSVRYHRLRVWDRDCNGKFGETGSGSFKLLKQYCTSLVLTF